MTLRTLAGLALALAVGILGPSLASVASHTGSGSGSLSGAVRDLTGAPVAGACVTAHFTFGDVAGTAFTAEDGTYAIRRLPAGRYKVGFADCHATVPGFVEEWWNDEPAFETADVIVLPHGTSITAIDAQVVGAPS